MFAKAHPKPQSCQTYVVKGSDEHARQVFNVFAQGEIARGAGAWTIVEKEGVHLVITFAKEQTFKSKVKYIQEELEKIPFGSFEVTIEKFTRPLQRFLGLGDLWATKEAVERAVKEEDNVELICINPA